MLPTRFLVPVTCFLVPICEVKPKKSIFGIPHVCFKSTSPEIVGYLETLYSCLKTLPFGYLA